MTQTNLGTFRVVDVRALYRRCASICGITFIFGAFIGAYISHSVFADEHNMVSQALVQVGDDLCKQWDGLAEIGRINPSHYAFRCRSLAVFPSVEVTLIKEN